MPGRTRILYALAPHARVFAHASPAPSALEGVAPSAPRADTPCPDLAEDGRCPSSVPTARHPPARWVFSTRSAVQHRDIKGRSPCLISSRALATAPEHPW